MKTNEVYEKIYLDKDESWHLTNPNGDSVEYIHTDAFIKKACDWFMRLDYDDSMPPFETTEEFIKYFKKYMKGE